MEREEYCKKLDIHLTDMDRTEIEQLEDCEREDCEGCPYLEVE